MTGDIKLVDRGRGLQLSTSRITVQDPVPHLQRGDSFEAIQRWLPTLSIEEIRVVDEYYRANKAILDEEDARIRRAQSERRRVFYAKFPPSTSAECRVRLTEFLAARRKENTGAGNSR